MPVSQQMPNFAGDQNVSVTGSLTVRTNLLDRPLLTTAVSFNASNAGAELGGSCEIKDNGDGTVTILVRNADGSASTTPTTVNWFALSN